MNSFAKNTRHTLFLVSLAAILATAGATVAGAAPAGNLAYQWHTFYGTTDSIGASYSVATDANGNVYVAGYTDKSWGNPLHAYSGGYDIMVIKLDGRGAYQWHTFYGASPTPGSDGDDAAIGIAADAQGNIYITGYSDRTWLGPGDVAPISPHGGDAEYMFALKLDTNGAYQWHTFFQPGRADAIAVDSSGVYVSGLPSSSWGSPKHPYGGKLMVLKLDQNGAYQWHTYYGAGASSADEEGYSIATDPLHGAVYVAGASPDTWVGDGDTQPLNPFSGGSGYSTDLVVLKLDDNGNYQWHTFYGAAEYDDAAYGIALDKGGNAYVAAVSFATWGTPLHDITGERDFAVLKLDAGGALQWNTFYGSGANDIPSGAGLDSDGSAYITGWTSNTWDGPNGESPLHPYSGGADIAVLQLSSDGAYQQHTFYGGTGDDFPYGISVNSQNNVYMTGESSESWLGDGDASPRHPFSGNDTGDTFVLKLGQVGGKTYLPLLLR